MNEVHRGLKYRENYGLCGLETTSIICRKRPNWVIRGIRKEKSPASEVNIVIINQSYNLKIEQLCESYNLGHLLYVKPLTGGYMHRVFEVQTDIKRYAIKALNPVVMMQPGMVTIMENTESISQLAKKTIPAITAKRLADSAIILIDGQYYLVYDWLDGVTLTNDHIGIKQCRCFGALLACLHNTDFTSLALPDINIYEDAMIDWELFMCLAEQKNTIWKTAYSVNIDKLYSWNKRLIDAVSANKI